MGAQTMGRWSRSIRPILQQAEAPMTARVERVARAIAETQQFAWGLNYETALEVDREHCRDIARAAIKAMSPPSSVKDTKATDG